MNDTKFFVGVKALIRNTEGDIFILNYRRKGGVVLHDLPGGRIKSGEQIEETLRREVVEELGTNRNNLVIHDLFDASVSKITLSKNVPLLLVTFNCELKFYDLEFNLSKEFSSYEWMKPRSATEFLGSKFNDDFLKKLEGL